MPLVRKAIETPVIAARDLTGIESALTKGSEEERWAAARAAHRMAGSGALLSAALVQEDSPRVREALFTGLALDATADGVERLLPFLRSDAAHLRTGTLDALIAMKGAVSPYLPQLLKDPDSDVRVLACELVRSVPGPEATSLLSALLETEAEQNVFASAVDVLAEIGGPEVLPVLSRCGERFRETPFLAFSIRVAVERIRANSSEASV